MMTSPTKGAKMKLALYSLSAADCTPSQVVSLARQHGAHGIEWWCRQQGHIDTDNLLPSVKQAAKLTRDAGLEIVGLAPYFRLDPLDTVNGILEAAAALGAPLVRCHTLGYPGYAPFAELARLFRNWLEQVLELCRQHNVRLAIEQHHHQIGCTPNACRTLVEGFPPQSVGVIYDPGNALWEGWTAPQYAIDVLGEYLAHVHAKSSRVLPGGQNRPRGRMAPLHGCGLAEGDIDWKDVITQLHVANYPGFLSLEALDARPSKQKVSEDLPFLQQLLASL